MDADIRTQAEQLSAALIELADEIDLARDDDATTEEIEEARALADEVLGRYSALLSRVTDPRHLALIGMPPADLLEAVCAAWEKAALDVVECLRRAAQVTNEWVYTAEDGDLRSRVTPRRIKETTAAVPSLAFWNCVFNWLTRSLCLTR